MEFIDFWLWSCESYLKFITCQDCTGSLGWSAEYYNWETSLVSFLVSPAAKPLSVPCSGAAHPDALRCLRANPDPFPSHSSVLGCARHLSMTAPAVPPCTTEEEKQGAEHTRCQAVTWWQVPHPSPLQPHSSHIQITVLSSSLQQKAWNLNQMQAFTWVYRQPGSNNSGRYKLLLSS